MTLFELHHTMDHQATILEESKQQHLLETYRQGKPGLGQRMIVTVGESLEQAGRWMKRQASPSTSPAVSRSMNSGLPVPR